MADRFPLIVNSVSKKIEEIVSGDNLDLSGNGLIVNGDTGAGKYLSSDGTVVFWGNTEGDSIKSTNVQLKPIGKFEGTLTEALSVLKASLPPSQAFLIHVEDDSISRAMVPLKR